MTDLEFLEANAHIPTCEIEKDILETEAEIRTLEIEADYLEKSTISLQSARLDHIRAVSKRKGIEDRKRFIEQLQHLLEIRRVATETAPKQS